MPATHSKSWKGHVYHWVTSLSFNYTLGTLINRLGTEDINCYSFASGIFANSWCQDLRCSTVMVAVV